MIFAHAPKSQIAKDGNTAVWVVELSKAQEASFRPRKPAPELMEVLPPRYMHKPLAGSSPSWAAVGLALGMILWLSFLKIPPFFPEDGCPVPIGFVV